MVENDRDDASFACIRSRNRGLKFNLEAIVGIEEVMADEQENEVGTLELFLDFRIQLISGDEFTVVPNVISFAAQIRHVSEKLFLVAFVGVRVGEK